MVKHISVVMAVHNRIDHVQESIKAWSLQTRRDFTLVVADDASTDPIRALSIANSRAFHVRHVFTGGILPLGVAATLNIGTKAVPGATTHIWYTDGDILFSPDAIENAYRHIAKYRKRVLAGRYDWIPKSGDRSKARADHRLGVHGKNWFDYKLLPSCRAILGANVIIPLQAWHDVGGWDELIPGANANDCDFGWCLTDAGYHLLTCDDITGYHQWHKRNKAFLDSHKKSMPYIFRKHGAPIPKQYRQYDHA